VALICDTGPLYAAMDRADADHRVCAALLANFREPVAVPAPVIVELDWLADLRLGFVDAAVVAIVERLGERKLATLDHRHFTAIRPPHVEALELLPA
jgi:predicted nucleic acid-binding protein